MSLLIPLYLQSLESQPAKVKNLAIWSVTLYIAAHTLAVCGGSSAQPLQWQQVRKVTMDVFFGGCFVFVVTGNRCLC